MPFWTTLQKKASVMFAVVTKSDGLRGGGRAVGSKCGDDLSGVDGSVGRSGSVDVGSRGRGSKGNNTEGLHFDGWVWGLVGWSGRSRKKRV